MVDALNLQGIYVTDFNSLTPGDPLIAQAVLDLQDGDMVLVENGALLKVHQPSACSGRHCWVHDPTPGHMVSWPIRWRDDKGTAERLCAHGIGHPDVDDIAYHLLVGRNVSVHGCDGCCENE